MRGVDSKSKATRERVWADEGKKVGAESEGKEQRIEGMQRG